MEASEQYDDGNERGEPDVDSEAVRVLPGTGGPDDVGDVDYHRDRDGRTTVGFAEPSQE